MNEKKIKARWIIIKPFLDKIIKVQEEGEESVLVHKGEGLHP